MRRAGKSVLFIHHSGKGGGQRGTSRKEDVLDTVIALRRPSDYSPEQGARFEIHFEKARGLFGNDAKSFQAHLADDRWLVSDLVEGDGDEVLKLKSQGLSLREIAATLGKSKSAVHRVLQEGSDG